MIIIMKTCLLPQSIDSPGLWNLSMFLVQSVYYDKYGP